MSMSINPEKGFAGRHIGPSDAEITEMLQTLGLDSLEQLVAEAFPKSILKTAELQLPEASTEPALIERLRGLADQNQVLRSYLGMGYNGTHTPGVILRNIMENPGWYTQYTPYQAEIAQGRLEALLNFQTMVMDLCGMEIASASLLDEGTAAAEAMSMVAGAVKGDRDVFFVSDECHPQTIAVVQTRAEPVGIEVVVGDWRTFEADERCFGALISYPATDGSAHDYKAFGEKVKAAGGYLVVVADLLALTHLTPPGEWGADVVVGNSQRFGVPMGYGGPHAGFMATKEDFKRRMPGRIIGVSIDANGNRALRMALQTREQHIRREKATSNICTAQVLLAIMAGMYAVYHGPDGLKKIGARTHALTSTLALGLKMLGHEITNEIFFDTLRVKVSGRSGGEVVAAALKAGINLRAFADGTVGVSLDETVLPRDVNDLFAAFNGGAAPDFTADQIAAANDVAGFGALARTSGFMEAEVFNHYHSETEMLRYIHRLETKDLSLNTAMIPLGSCTMKLNATTEMIPVTWPEFGALHPFAPKDQAAGYSVIFNELSDWLMDITGFSGVSLQPNSGAQGEYAGLQVIRAYHLDHGNTHRKVCLIPSSAHGTNPASAVMCGMKVVIVKVDENGAIDMDDLSARATEHAANLAAIMVTYPSTHGVFDAEIKQVCDIVHQNGGLVYLDGANLNAQVGISRPGDYGADVCHINLHKTFAIPHGGGGPGMGPICCNDKLKPYLPGHPVVPGVGGAKAIGPISAAPWGSSSILLISWAYIALLGRDGVRKATEVAVLNANYMAKRLEGQFDVLFRGKNGRVAHEFILDMRPFKRDSGISEEDVAKRLQDYGFHGPTMSWPVVGTIMVEPTESESKDELDRFCNALLSIRAEMQQVEMGIMDPEDNPLKNAPHTADVVMADEWNHKYTREQAAYPAPWTRIYKFWPTVGRVDNAYGDRNLVCACPPIEEYAQSISE